MDRMVKGCITRRASRGLYIHEILGLVINQVAENYATMRYATRGRNDQHLRADQEAGNDVRQVRHHFAQLRRCFYLRVCLHYHENTDACAQYDPACIAESRETTIGFVGSILDRQSSRMIRFCKYSCVSHALTSGGVNLLGAMSGPSPGAVRVNIRRLNA